MQTRKFLTISIILVMGITPILPNLSAIQINLNTTNTSEIPESHIIENVHYVSQGKSLYCAYATITMIFQYYQVNASLFEVLYNSGVGYSVGYKITYPCLSLTGYIMSQGTEDRQFLAELYGLNYSHHSINDKSISDENKWQMYWAYAKQNITKNIPVSTEVKMDELPYYENISDSHYVVIVGFNETNNTVCVHDSFANVSNKSHRGAYIHIPIDLFKKSLNDAYFFEIFEDTTDKPLPKKEAFEIAHSRNIKRMKGDANAYDKEFIKTQLGVHIFGVNALKFIKQSYKIRNILLLNIMGKIKGTDNIHRLATYCYQISSEKHNMSQYLIENADLHSDAMFEAEMLEIESNNWKFLSIQNWKLWYITKDIRIPFKILACIPILKEIRSTLDTIAYIEKAIIHGLPPVNPP